MFGALITVLFLNRFVNAYLLSIIFIITAGIMITLSVLKIFNEGIKIKPHKWFILGILLGTLIIYLTL